MLTVKSDHMGTITFKRWFGHSCATGPAMLEGRAPRYREIDRQAERVISVIEASKSTDFCTLWPYRWCCESG